MRKLILAACLALASLTLGHAAHAGCPVPNPNLQAPPFYDGCIVPAIALNRLGAPGPVFSPLGYGAKCDGVTDDTAALNATAVAAVSTGGSIAWPGKTCYSATGVTFAGPIAIRGTSFVPSLDSGLMGSALECPNSITTCLKLTGGTGALNSVSISDLFVYGNGTTPASGATGIWQSQGAMVTWRNVASVNWDTCAKFSSSSQAGIRMSGQSIFVGSCFTHHYVVDGWPEILINGGTADVVGDNSVAATGASDFIYGTNTACTTGGCGPNSINFENYNFITNGGVACFFSLAGNQHPTDGVVGEFRFTDDHVEFHDAANAPQGLICSDSTIPMIDNLYITNMVTSTAQTGAASGAYLPMWSLNSLTSLKEVHITDSDFDNCFYSGAPAMNTLAPVPNSGAAFNSVHFVDNTYCTGPTFTAGSSSGNNLSSTGNQYGAMTLSGAWTDFESFGDYVANIADTSATGGVAISSAYQKSWTPTLAFSVSGSVTYSVESGTVQRNGQGGFDAGLNIVLSGTSSPSGNVTITGLPYQCGTSGAATASGSIGYAVGFTGLTGSLQIGVPLNTSGTPLNLYQYGSAGVTTVTGSDLTSSTAIIGTIHCSKTK